MNRAVVLLSGGLDSATTLAVAREDGFACHALSIAYGHRYGAKFGTKLGAELGAATRCEVPFSPAWQRRDAVGLADWILADCLPVPVPLLLQLQLHKLPWVDVPGPMRVPTR